MPPVPPRIPTPPRRILTAPSRRAKAALAVVVLASALGLPGAPARAGDPGGGSWNLEREVDLNARRRAAVKKGCAWIAGRKQNYGGAFGDEKAVVAFTALSTLALMAGGSSMGRGPHGEAVKKGIEYLVGLVEKPSGESPIPGYFYVPNDANSRMHGQGFATLALATALGSADTETAARIRVVLRKACDLAKDSQTGTGGWGYLPNSATEHEGSVTVTVAQGLRAARDAGVLVSRDTIARGLAYLRKSQRNHPPGTAQEHMDGSFKYSISTERSTYALTAAALSCFFLFGEYGGRPDDRDRMERAIRFLKRSLSRQLAGEDSVRLWHFYGNFYAAFAAWQWDGDEPAPRPGQSWSDDVSSDDIERTSQFWGPWHTKVYEDLIGGQKADGSWHDESDPWAFGDLLPTTFAVLTLAVPDEQIPLFQR